MSLRNRLDALERRLAQAGITDECPACGGPVPGYNAVVLHEEGEEPETCQECGLVLDAEGKPLNARAGAGETKRIVLLGAE